MVHTLRSRTYRLLGDDRPASSLGRFVNAAIIVKILASLVSLLGVGMVAFPSGILAAGFVEQIRRG